MNAGLTTSYSDMKVNMQKNIHFLYLFIFWVANFYFTVFTLSSPDSF